MGDKAAQSIFVEVETSLDPWILSAKLRMSYLFPDVSVEIHQNGVSISCIDPDQTQKAAEHFRYVLYRERILGVFGHERQQLYKALLD